PAHLVEAAAAHQRFNPVGAGAAGDDRDFIDAGMGLETFERVRDQRLPGQLGELLGLGEARTTAAAAGQNDGNAFGHAALSRRWDGSLVIPDKRCSTSSSSSSSGKWRRLCRAAANA